MIDQMVKNAMKSVAPKTMHSTSLFAAREPAKKTAAQVTMKNIVRSENVSRVGGDSTGPLVTLLFILQPSYHPADAPVMLR